MFTLGLSLLLLFLRKSWHVRLGYLSSLPSRVNKALWIKSFMHVEEYAQVFKKYGYPTLSLVPSFSPMRILKACSSKHMKGESMHHSTSHKMEGSYAYFVRDEGEQLEKKVHMHLKNLQTFVKQ